MIRKRQTAFTVVEMLIVVVIVCIAAALAIPMVNSSRSVKLSSAAQMVMSDLMYAQNYAIANQKYVYIAFKSSSNYRIYTWTPGGAQPDDASFVPTNASQCILGPNSTRMWVNLGGTGAADPLGSVYIRSANNTDPDSQPTPPQVIGFDPLGQTRNNQGSLRTDATSVVISTAKASSSNASTAPIITLTIQPYSDEITVK